MTTRDASPKKIGLTMLVIAWLMFFGLLAMVFKEVLEQQSNPNSAPESHHRSNGSIEVQLLPNRQHHYVTRGKINHQSVVFLLDTGATDVVIPEQLAQRLGLQRGLQQFAHTANGTVRVYHTTIDQLSIGDIELRELRASINPAMQGETILLGMSALSQIEFKQSGERLILRQSR